MRTNTYGVRSLCECRLSCECPLSMMNNSALFVRSSERGAPERGWSDARFVAERSGLEDQDVEDGQRDGQEEIRVVEWEDRLEGFDPAYP